MKVVISDNKWQFLLLATPLVLILVFAIAMGSMSNAADAAYGAYGCGGAYGNGCDQAPSASLGVSDQLLYVANGDDSNVAIIDVGTMNIVNYVPVTRAPDGLLAGLGMLWEIHGVVPSNDRTSIYTVGALSGTSDSADLIQTDISTGTELRRIAMTGSLVGYCGLEYDLNDTTSDNLVATDMAAGPGVAASLEAAFDPAAGGPLPPGTLPVTQGGWQENSLSAGTATNHISTDFDGDGESSTCGVSWNAAGTVGYASLMWDAASSVTIDWAGSKTATAENPASPGSVIHQNTAAKSRDLLFVTGGTGGVIEIVDMITNATVGTIDMTALTGVGSAEPHGVEIVPGNDNLMYAQVRQVPNPLPGGGSVLLMDVSNLNAPSIVAGVTGMNKAACGVYADADKSLYYEANGSVASGKMALVANGNASDVAVIDFDSMSVTGNIPVTRAPDGLLAGLGMLWEIHGVVPSNDSTSIYTVGALSGTSDSADLIETNSATGVEVRRIAMTGSLVGYCGLEYDLNDTTSDNLVATDMAAGPGVAASLEAAFDPAAGGPLPPGTLPVTQGGWQENSLSAGTATNHISTDFDGDGESSTCGVSWNAAGTVGYASLMWDAASSVTIDWAGSKTATAENPASPGSVIHQNTAAKSRDLLFVTGGTGGVIEVVDMVTNATVGSIDMAAVTNSPSAEPHGVDIVVGEDNTLYANVRQVPDPLPGGATVLVMDIASPLAPVVKGSIQGLNDASCGIYVMEKTAWNPGQPALSLTKGATYWASMADYNNGILSVDYTIGNAGPDAKDVTIAGTSNSAGVVSVNTPSLSQDIATGGNGPFTVEYQVGAASAFSTTVYATAQSGPTIYSYPGPYPGP